MHLKIFLSDSLLFFTVNIAIQFSGSCQKMYSYENNFAEINISEGTVCYWLYCPAGEKRNEVVWMKDGLFLSLNKPKYIQFHKIMPTYLPILCASQENEGNYTCYRSLSETKSPLTKIVVKVTRHKNVYPCGRPNNESIEELCPTPTWNDFPCCLYFAPPPRNLVITTTFDHSEKKCNLYKAPKLDQSWNINIKWDKPYYGHEKVWGWQVTLVGLRNDANFHHCIQINDGNKILNWTIPNRLNLPLGASYIITVQSLPSQNGHKGYVPNYKNKTFKIPTLKEICANVGHECKWEICESVNNISVIDNTTSALVMWDPPKYNKLVASYEIDYRAANNCDEVKDKVKVFQNETRLIIKRSNNTSCKKYIVKIRPIFRTSVYGTYAEVPVWFNAAFTTVSTNRVPTVKKGSKFIKTYIACTASVFAILLILFLVIFKKYKNAKTYRSNLQSDSLLDPLNLSRLPSSLQDKGYIEVFIVHDNHCNACNHATHCLAHVLNETGYINCILDICSTVDIAELGLYPWHDKMLENSDKILIICSKEGKRIYDGKTQQHFCQSASMYRSDLTMIRRRMNADYRCNVKVVPVFYECSVPENIPFFLSDRTYYNLPSKLDLLVLTLIGVNARPMASSIEYKINRTSELQNKISKFEAAIKDIGKTH